MNRKRKENIITQILSILKDSIHFTLSMSVRKKYTGRHKEEEYGINKRSRRAIQRKRF